MSRQTGNGFRYKLSKLLSSTPVWPPFTSAPILALVIGINKYPHQMTSLQCAVDDANDFEKFLKERLNVPNKNIISLRDGQASRTAILKSFILLKDNQSYKKNEAAIIIYYAGHGAQTNKPEGWQDWVTSSGRIEMLCPSDIGCRTTICVNGKKHEDVIRGIPDRTISALLNQISDTKGNNITLILDCCSSAGINRGGDSERYVTRRILHPPQIENNTDKEIWSHSGGSDRTRGGISADGSYGRFHGSHVLLAACGRDRLALEDLDIMHGIFTYSLMKVLNENDINTLTYTSLMHKMEMPERQTAHCEGREVDRRLFNNHTSGANSSLILARRKGLSKMGSRIILEAGAAQGITVGSRMAVYPSNLLQTAGTSNSCLGYLTVLSVGHFTCVLEVPSDTIQQFRPPAHSFQVYCLLEYPASQNIALYCKNKHLRKTVFPPEQENKLGMTIVDDVECCDLESTVIGRKVYFDRHRDVLVTPYIGARISRSIDVGDVSEIREVVKRSSHFYHHLTRTGGVDLRDVWMELNLLKLSDDFAPSFIPTGKNLIANEPATIVVDEDARLGMTIFNKTDLPLYPYLFYFDPTDLTIVEWNTPPFGAGPGKVDAPLPPKSRYALGYGDGGAFQWRFTLRPGQKKDIGFFKLFLCTRSTDFSCILQPSRLKAQDGLCRGGGQVISDIRDVEMWATKLVTVIQVDSDRTQGQTRYK